MPTPPLIAPIKMHAEFKWMDSDTTATPEIDDLTLSKGVAIWLGIMGAMILTSVICALWRTSKHGKYRADRPIFLRNQYGERWDTPSKSDSKALLAEPHAYRND
ncbi:hypothetical protein PLICRDRAFT_28853 [Plicaturopsis crispa FD-325 SS-3]|nr:hypothetical protein PLICRDRAFT_28853 [Plicaturopsis crispa FD-325 SS-3]